MSGDKIALVTGAASNIGKATAEDLGRDHTVILADVVDTTELAKRIGKTTVFVTHDIFEALTLADRIAVLHDGRLQQVDTPQKVLTNPATHFVRELFEKPARQLAAFQGGD